MRLVKHIGENWIRSPSRVQYKLQQLERRDHSMGQSLVVDYILGQKVRTFNSVSNFFYIRDYSASLGTKSFTILPFALLLRCVH